MLLTRLIDCAISPLGFGLLLAAALWIGRRRMPRALWRFVLALEFPCLLLATPLGANRLASLQEHRVSAQPCTDAAALPIVLLAGGLHRRPLDADDVGALNEASLQRTLAAAALVAADPHARLVISGGVWRGGDDDATSPAANRVSESALMRALAQRLGVPADAIRIEIASRTTWENAAHVRALEPALPRRIRLVTSALHMPRALLAFEAFGFEPCAAAVDFRSTPYLQATDVLPSGGAVALSTAVLHEWVGELGYRVRARFTAPAQTSAAAMP